MTSPEIPGKLIASVSAAIAQALAPPPRGRPKGGPLLPRGMPPPVMLPASSALAVQMLMPMAPWDWPTATIGSIPYAQFILSDTVPASSVPGVAYEPTGASLSGNYTMFLNLIAARQFVAPNILDAAIAMTAQPPSTPGTATAPDGWAASPDSAGIIRWRPAYGVNLTPDRWLTQLANSQGSEVTLALPINDEKALAVTDQAGQTTVLSLAGEADHAQITAAALAQVTVTPGRWFQDALLRLGRNGPWLSGLAPDAPYGGMLSARVSGLIVACNPVLRIVGPDPVNSVTGAALSAAQSVQIAGFTFPAPVQQKDAATPAPVYGARSAGTWIVGVTVEAFP
jgi:hypothetical protein